MNKLDRQTVDSIPALEIKDLSVSLGGHLVLEEINLKIYEREFLGIIGPNGGGKSVLLKTILGLIEPQKGSVKIFGKQPEERRNQVGYVPQFARFEANFPATVLEVVLMGRLSKGFFGRSYSKKDRELSLTMLERMSMLDIKNAAIAELSGGQLQRVLIARALVGEPRMLLLDEPSASLDTLVGQNFYELLRQLSEELTVILVSHDLTVIAEYVQAVACLNRRLHFHSSKEISADVIEQVYGCPVELLAHGHAHRVLGSHDGEN